MARANFVGVGVGEYEKDHPRLEHAVSDVEAFAGLRDIFVKTDTQINPPEHVTNNRAAGLNFQTIIIETL